jgi:uncharacterized protein
MADNPVGWFEIYVQDMARARAFYEAVFETRLQELPDIDVEMLAFGMDGEAPGSSGALVRADDCPSGGNSTLVYFKCADCAVEAGRAADSGGRLVKDKFSIGPYGFVALVNDSEGNLIGLHSQA